MRNVSSVTIFTLLVVTALAAAFYVQPVRTTPATIFVPTDYTTIQEAINNANEGDTIYVLNGEYYENIIANRTVTLEGESRSGTIINGSGLDYLGPLVAITANNVSMFEFTVTQSGAGHASVEVTGANYCEIHHNIVSFSGERGITFTGGSHNEAYNNVVYNSSAFGSIEAIFSNNNTIHNNIAYFNAWGIATNGASHNAIYNNTIYSNGKGLNIEWSSTHNTVFNNTVSSNTNIGIHVSHQSNTTTIFDNNIHGSYHGVRIEDSVENTILGNNITNNDYGVSLDSSTATVIHSNLIKENNMTGIDFYNSWDNHILQNAIELNDLDGITLRDVYCRYNTIIGNGIVANIQNGVAFLGLANNNTIFHNVFINNTANAFPGNETNFWDDGYPSGGNFWSDYLGNDIYRGPFQNETGYDGIGDELHLLSWAPKPNIDRYPLMGPFGPLTLKGANVTVLPTDAIHLIYAKVEQEGETTAAPTDSGPDPPDGRHWLSRFEIETTADYSGKIMIRILYSDENLTQEQEVSLQLTHWMLQGDITGGSPNLYDFIPDGQVDIKDVALIAKYFGTDVPAAPPKCDITGPTPNVPDGKIDIRDIALAAIHFGSSQLELINITTFLDLENNMIFGETSRLSIYGITFWI
ncbi:MAG: right-handed parallel beta-helix repeat-containing protein [Candidatus Bathyarchaeota archaeon]|nr:MAG: right-handed parallel beta-helix repeat-containing protein [Candidatus Bathyarchaeota archaeon]